MKNTTQYIANIIDRLNSRCYPILGILQKGGMCHGERTRNKT